MELLFPIGLFAFLVAPRLFGALLVLAALGALLSILYGTHALAMVGLVFAIYVTAWLIFRRL